MKMPKRQVEQPSKDGEEAYNKRQKIKHIINATEDIHSSRQLQQLLAFDQDGGRARQRILSFKAFLDGFVEEDNRKARLPILREYLESQKPRDEEGNAAVYLADIMQTWSFASQSNNDSLLSAVPAVLDLLLKTLSTNLELSEYGRRIGRTLLQKRQLELLTRGLTSNKSKEFIISPALRLVREVLTFDGGAFAKDVFRARDYTFKALGRNLGLRYTGDGIEDRRRPSIRTHALRFFLACIKWLPTNAKKELLNQRDIVLGTMRDISSDPPYVVAEFLEIIKLHILHDEKLPREAKSKYFSAASLGRIVGLYGYDQIDDRVQEGKKSVDALAHEFLLLACTSPDLGVLHWQSGFYPRGIDPNQGNNGDGKFIDLGLESLEWADKFTEKVPVRNTILSEFIQSLRPWSDMRQSELLLRIFKAAPELVADYFFNKKSFSFDPKLTTTWIGYSALLFSTVQLPVPLYLGHQNSYGRLPPPSSIVIESILPSPLTQKVLKRCLNQKSSLITFFTVRLLIVAFQKLQDVLGQYLEVSITGSAIWDEAARQLTETFCRRCPAIKDIIVTFSNISDADLLQKHAASKLLVMYHETIPQIALESKFDVSNPLAEALRLLEEHGADSKDDALRVMTVENLFQVAHCSPGMRWFNKAESLPFSPFTAMLRLSVQASYGFPLLKMRSVVDSVIKESGIMQLRTQKSALDALLTALKTIQKDNMTTIYEFLDNCIMRCAATPVKYVDALEKYSVEVYGSEAENSQECSVSLLHLAVIEQWPFAVKSSEADKINDIASFIANYIGASFAISEDKRILKAIVQHLIANLPEGSPFKKSIERSRKLATKIDIPEPAVSDITATIKAQNFLKDDYKDIEKNMLDSPGLNVDDHGALTRWTAKDIEEVIEENHAAALIALLSSPHLSIRKEALSNLHKLSHKLQSSTHPEKNQIWLLLSELLETATIHNISTSPLPTPISAFASHALSVLLDPLHVLYPKLNAFLSRGPLWDADKLPLVNTILHEPPVIDDALYAEIAFLLTYLADGLGTSTDMAIYHKRRVIEKLLSLYQNPYLGMRKGLKEGIIRVLWKATAVEGGSTTLVTRFGVLGWVEARIGGCDGSEARDGEKRKVKRREDGVEERQMRALKERVLKTCDKERVGAWSGKVVDVFDGAGKK